MTTVDRTMSIQLPGIATLPMSDFVNHRAQFFEQMKPNSIAFFGSCF